MFFFCVIGRGEVDGFVDGFEMFIWISKLCYVAGQCALKELYEDFAIHAYMSSHSPSSSSSLGGGGGSFSFTRSFLSSGHVACSFNQGAMHSRSNMWFLLHGRRTTRGYSSAVCF